MSRILVQNDPSLRTMTLSDRCLDKPRRCAVSTHHSFSNWSKYSCNNGIVQRRITCQGWARQATQEKKQDEFLEESARSASSDAIDTRDGKRSKRGFIGKWLPRWRRPVSKGRVVEEPIPLASKLDSSAMGEDPSLYDLGDGMASVIPEQTLSSMESSLSSSEDFVDDVSLVPDTFSAAAQEMERLGYLTTTNTGSLPSNRRYRRQKRKNTSQTIDSPDVPMAHESLQLIRERMGSGSLPGKRTDPYKLGLVVEGGGMRGCVSGGALQALADLGLQNAFDAVYGSSAGAINGTYFLSGQRDGVDIYHKHIASTEFIDLKRLLNRKPGGPAALNLEYLLDHVIEEVLPLDFDAVLQSSIPLKVVASSLDSLTPVLLEDFNDKRDLVECLRASANVPKVAGGPVLHRGHRLVDAAVFEAVPFRSAIADGCTHIVVLCTRPAPLRKSAIDKALTDALQATIKKAVMNPDYMVDAWKESVKHLMMDGMSNDDILLRSLDERSHELPWFAGTHVLPIYPSSHASSFSPLCTDVPTLKQGVAEGRRAVLAIAKAALPEVVDLSMFGETEMSNQTANIVPTTMSLKKALRAKKN